MVYNSRRSVLPRNLTLQPATTTVTHGPSVRVTPAIGMQAPTQEQDSDVARRMQCSKCMIIYYVGLDGPAHCPLCDANSRILELQQVMHGMRNEVENLTAANNRMAASLDVVTAVKNAIDLVSVEDLTFLKSVLYRYREDHASITLRATRGDNGVNGFMAIPRVGDPESVLCSSIGGVAIAAYFEETVRASGGPNALKLLMHALAGALAIPGG